MGRRGGGLGSPLFLPGRRVVSRPVCVKTWRHLPPPAGTDKPGRPLNDDAIFLKPAARGGNPGLRTMFYQVADRLLREEDPPGNWIGFGPCNAITGMIHPRQAYWWGRSMIDAFRDS